MESPRTTLDIPCDFCGRLLSIRKREYQAGLDHNKRYFCDQECYKSFRHMHKGKQNWRASVGGYIPSTAKTRKISIANRAWEIERRYSHARE